MWGILKPENVILSILSITENSKLAGNFSLDNADKLNALISIIFQHPEQELIIQNLLSTCPDELKYLIKLQMIEFLRLGFNESNLEFKNEIQNYLLEAIKHTPELFRSIENDNNFNIFSYLKPDYSSQEKLNELKEIVEFVSLDLLIAYCGKLIRLN